jgi:hypothetical protein
MDRIELPRPDLAKVLKGVVKVNTGRGLVVQAKGGRWVVTAAHCLPDVPHNGAASFEDELIYTELLGRLKNKKPKVPAECAFVNPVADIALLWSPNPELWREEAEVYKKLMKVSAPLQVANAPSPSKAWLISLDGRLIPCTVECDEPGMTWWIKGAAEPIVGGMSGSPVLAEDGSAIGVVSRAKGFVTESGQWLGNPCRGPFPHLAYDLSNKFFRHIIGGANKNAKAWSRDRALSGPLMGVVEKRTSNRNKAPATADGAAKAGGPGDGSIRS